MKLNATHRWPLAITTCFILFFAGLVTFIVFASTQRMDLVRPDYYEHEIRYQEQLDRITRTRSVNEAVEIAYDAEKRVIALTLPPTHVAQCSGLIQLYRPSDARLDLAIPLVLDAQGMQVLDAKALRSGLWRIRVQWTVAEQEYYFDRSIVIPARS